MEPLIIFMLILTGDLISTASSRPTDPRQCIFNQNRKLINCRGEHLGRVPYTYFQNKSAETIDLGMNNIPSLNEFSEISNKREITRIHLDNNQIAELPDNLFNDLPSLQELDLTNNRLKNIDFQFCNIPSLVVLILSDNPLEKISRGAFNFLPNLESLYLKNCNISELPTDIFKGSNLKYIELSGNDIKNIDKVYFPENFKIFPDPEKFNAKYPSSKNNDAPAVKQTASYEEVFIIAIYIVGFIIVTVVVLPMLVVIVWQYKYIKKDSNI